MDEIAEPHRVRRVVFRIAAPDEAAVRAFGARVRASGEAWVNAALDAVDVPGAAQRLRRLDVDLGRIGADDVEVDRIVAAFRNAFARSGVAAEAEQVPGRLAATDFASTLVRFLRTGRIGWALDAPSLDALMEGIIELDATDLARLAATVRPALFEASGATRLAMQAPPELVRALTRELTAAWPEARRVALAFRLEAAFESGDERAVAAAVGAAAARGSRRPSSPSAPATAINVEEFEVAPAGPESKPAVPQAAGDVAHDDDSVETARSEAGTTAALQVENAGLVLLHPFLGKLFESLGLLDSTGNLSGETARVRAVHLLHFLATGRTRPAEPETTLAKLLCGMVLEAPLPRSVDPTEAERVEVGELLQAAIRHWDKLGSTSPDALREGFLMRPGRLVAAADPPRLIVEPRSIDVLLDAMPWSLSPIKHRWMDRSLSVEWR